MGPETAEGKRWYFSLNNRRLWVLKRCREEGLLVNNVIQVRQRAAKSKAESERYTIDNCALEATIMRKSTCKSEALAANKKTAEYVALEELASNECTSTKRNEENSSQSLISAKDSSDDESNGDDSSCDDIPSISNRFTALM
jgi:hypothetical protein